MIVELLEVKEKNINYKSEAKKEIGNIFRIVSAINGLRGQFNKINSSDYIKTSVIERIDIQMSMTKAHLEIETENSLYVFEEVI